jgi:hypothetical protein
MGLVGIDMLSPEGGCDNGRFEDDPKVGASEEEKVEKQAATVLISPSITRITPTGISL